MSDCFGSKNAVTASARKTAAQDVYEDTKDIDIARHVACIIIGDPNFEIRALDARDYIDYCMATHEYERLATLTNDALDLYLKGVISLHEFKLIIAANKN